jgi:hypothetical protein
MKSYKTVKVEGLSTRKEQDEFKRQYVLKNKDKLKNKYAGIDFEFY